MKPAHLLWLVAAACDGEPEVQAKDPEPRRAVLPEFQAMAKAEPPVPDEQTFAGLRDLLEMAFTGTDPRLAGKARRSLLAEEHADRVLEWALKHDSPAVRSNAAFELGNRAHAAAVPLLLRRRKDEQDPETILFLADALARLGNLAFLEDLTDAMGGDDAGLAQRAGLMAIGILQSAGRDPGEQPSYARLRDGLQVLHRFWRTLGRGPRGATTDPGPVECARLARCFVDLEGFQLRPVDEARYVLSRMGLRSVPLLRRALLADEQYLRQHGLEVLQRMGRPGIGAAPEVRALLRDKVTRAEAARTLGALGDHAAVAELVALLASPDLDVRCAAAGALGPLRDAGVVPRLRALLADGQQPLDLRVQAAFSLAILEPSGEGLAFLQERREKGDYHDPTIDELIDRVVASW